MNRNDREKLIEAQRVLTLDLKARQSPGDGLFPMSARAVQSMRDALSDLVAVFEKAHTPSGDEREVRAIVRRAVGGVLFHVTNFPERAQPYLLGENMGPLNEKITEAVLAALGLPVSRDLVRRVDVALSVIAHEGGDVRVKQALDYVKAAFANQSLILDFVAPEQGEPSDAQSERARIIADLREWSRPLGNSPEEETLRLVIDRIERATGGAR